MNIHENIKKIINKRSLQIEYVEEVAIKLLQEEIEFSSQKYSILLGVYKQQYFNNIIKALETQKQIFVNYLLELESIYNGFKEDLEGKEITSLDDSIVDYEESLVNSICMIKALIEKFNILVDFYTQSTEEVKNETKQLNY